MLQTLKPEPAVGSWLRVPDFADGFRALCLGFMGSGFRISGLKFRGLGCRSLGFGV